MRILLIFTLITIILFAHSGGTNSEGCHSGTQEYHCHNGGYDSEYDDYGYEYSSLRTNYVPETKHTHDLSMSNYVFIVLAGVALLWGVLSVILRIKCFLVEDVFGKDIKESFFI